MEDVSRSIEGTGYAVESHSQLEGSYSSVCGRTAFRAVDGHTQPQA